VRSLSEITAVVGPNAAGKTALLHAMSKLFGVSRAQRTVLRSDFHLGADDDPEDREPKDMSSGRADRFANQLTAQRRQKR
jgi:predicted ATP-dependent endonuclease of OLD family